MMKRAGYVQLRTVSGLTLFGTLSAHGYVIRNCQQDSGAKTAPASTPLPYGLFCQNNAHRPRIYIYIYIPLLLTKLGF